MGTCLWDFANLSLRQSPSLQWNLNTALVSREPVIGQNKSEQLYYCQNTACAPGTLVSSALNPIATIERQQY